MAVQARTLEFYAQLGIADAVIQNGRWATAVNLLVKRKADGAFGVWSAWRRAEPVSLRARSDPQDEHERFLIECLAAEGIHVERSTELAGFQHADCSVRAQIVKSDGTREFCRVGFIAGCDGAHSIVRERLGIGFPGGTYEHTFYVADVEAKRDFLI